jgi:archaellum component FlaG (FlaF/FlaG flagellin family)
MADGGTSEMIMLTAALIIAGIVSSVLLASFDGVSDSIAIQNSDTRVDAQTRAALVGDPMVMNWNGVTNNMTIHIQNTGSAQLDPNVLQVRLSNEVMTIQSASANGPSNLWTAGSLMTLNVTSGTFSPSSGDEVLLTIIVQSELYGGSRGGYSFTEVIRID